MRKLAAFAVAAAIVAAAIPVMNADARTTKRVNVGNNFFSKSRVSIKRGDRVTWVWTQGRVPHNVRRNGKGSRTTSRKGFRYTKTFRRKGSFRYICTLHPEMRTTVRVR